MPAVPPLKDDEVTPAKVVVDMIIIVGITTPIVWDHRHAAALVTAEVAAGTVTIASRQHTVLGAHLQVTVSAVLGAGPDAFVK